MYAPVPQNAPPGPQDRNSSAHNLPPGLSVWTPPQPQSQPQQQQQSQYYNPNAPQQQQYDASSYPQQPLSANSQPNSAGINNSSQYDASMRMRHASPQMQHQQQPMDSSSLPASFLSNPVAQFAINSYGSQLKSKLAASGLFGIRRVFAPYFHVSHDYVVKKCKLLLLPFVHKAWRRQRMPGWPEIEALNGSQGTQSQLAAQQQVLHLDPQNTGATGYETPQSDVNAPDLYIPLMSFITLVLLLSYRRASSTASLNQSFDPELIAQTAGSLVLYASLECAFLYAALFVIGCTSALSSTLDLLAISCYKYVHCILIVLLTMVLPGAQSTLIYYSILFVLALQQSLFVMRTLKAMLTPLVEPLQGGGHSMGGGAKRNYFLCASGAIQILLVAVACRAA